MVLFGSYARQEAAVVGDQEIAGDQQQGDLSFF